MFLYFKSIGFQGIWFIKIFSSKQGLKGMSPVFQVHIKWRLFADWHCKMLQWQQRKLSGFNTFKTKMMITFSLFLDKWIPLSELECHLKLHIVPLSWKKIFSIYYLSFLFLLFLKLTTPYFLSIRHLFCICPPCFLYLSAMFSLSIRHVFSIYLPSFL